MADGFPTEESRLLDLKKVRVFKVSAVGPFCH